MWRRSPSLLTFSDLFFLTFFSVPPPPVFFPGLDVPADWRSVGCWLTTASLVSSSSATASFDQDLFATSYQSEEKKHLRLERAATVVSFSFDPPPAGMGVGTPWQITFSRLFR